jgi:hypothetical protein
MADLDARCFLRRGNSLVPADASAEEFLSELADGREVTVTIRKPRNPAHHRWFFALLRLVVSNSDDWSNEEELLDALKLATGHTERRMTIDGNTYLAPRSISFAAMGEEAFKRFKARACYVLATKVLNVNPEDLMREVDATQKRAA